MADKVKLTRAQIEELQAKARNCRNNARAELLVVDAFKDEYVAGLSRAANPPTPEMFRHTTETYDFYVGGQHRAKQFIKDAELFEASAALGLSLIGGSTDDR